MFISFEEQKNLKDFLCKTHILLPQEGNTKGGKSNIYPHIHTHRVRLQLVKSLVIIIRTHVVKVFYNYASRLIIYKVNRNFSFLPIIYFPQKSTT